jgi:sortase A
MAAPNTANRRSTPLRRELGRAVRAHELTLAAGGTVCLLAWGFACARASYTQSEQGAAFDAALHHARVEQLQTEAPNREEWSPARIAAYEASLVAPVEALGRLEIPEAGVSVMVLDGTKETTLDRAVGRIEGTAPPDGEGNLGIAGHRDGYFRGLRHLRAGHEITLTTLSGVAHYEVERTLVVDPDRVDVLAPTDQPTLTLVTCYPFYHVGSAPERFIVVARRTRYEPWPGAQHAGDRPELASHRASGR